MWHGECRAFALVPPALSGAMGGWTPIAADADTRYAGLVPVDAESISTESGGAKPPRPDSC